MMSNFKTSGLAALALAAGLSAASLPAVASGNAVNVSMEKGSSLTVRYWDLDIAKQSDARELYSRISHAAYSVCRDQRDIRSLLMNRFYKQCIETAIDNAVHDVGNVNLTALHTGRDFAVASQ